MARNPESTPSSRCAALVGPQGSGKTTLFEDLLFAAGAIPRRGTAREGNTEGDNAPEARARAMSTESTLASFTYLDEGWSLIDCPGSVELAQEAQAAMVVDHRIRLTNLGAVSLCGAAGTWPFVNKEHEAPDFEVHDGRSKVFIEAVIAGPSPNDPPLDPPKNGMPRMRTPEEIKDLLKTRVPIRFGSALYSKLNRKTKYWNLEHVKGNPLVFAVADFHEDQSMTWTSPALLEYLYGVTHEFIFDDTGQLIITPLEDRNA